MGLQIYNEPTARALALWIHETRRVALELNVYQSNPKSPNEIDDLIITKMPLIIMEYLSNRTSFRNLARDIVEEAR